MNTLSLYSNNTMKMLKFPQLLILKTHSLLLILPVVFLGIYMCGDMYFLYLNKIIRYVLFYKVVHRNLRALFILIHIGHPVVC